MDKRTRLEKRLISTVSNCKECFPSDNWLGLFSTIEKVRKSGLWQEHHLRGNELNDSDMEFIKKLIVQ